MREFENNNCNNEVRDVVTLIDRAIPYTCVEEAEIVQLPTYQQLLDLPPAVNKPIVAV